ncbi:hypothetical protein [Bradyrhizobium sp. CB1650]|uniref:hypothetical protein n=1 Tax=Bradyrhizobium sp. CB1650 TaxID=3039153 RepID=UPI00325FCBB5
MKLTTERPYAHPEAAARKLLELAKSIEAVQDGRIHVEKVNAPFLYTLKGNGSEFGAGIKYAIEKGWLEMHESGTFVRLLTNTDRKGRGRWRKLGPRASKGQAKTGYSTHRVPLFASALFPTGTGRSGASSYNPSGIAYLTFHAYGVRDLSDDR